MPTDEERAKALEAKLQQVRARIAMREARKRKMDSKRQRADDTRRKILAGSVVLAESVPPQVAAWLKATLARSLHRADDRALFGLGPLPGAATPAAGAARSAAPQRAESEF